jgi:hypothetical protein
MGHFAMIDSANVEVDVNDCAGLAFERQQGYPMPAMRANASRIAGHRTTAPRANP